MKVSDQEYWDMLILDGWTQDQKLGRILRDFSRWRGQGPDDGFDALMEGIKRSLIISYRSCPHKPVRAVVANRLPKLSQYLWHIFPNYTDETYKTAMHILINSKQVGGSKKRRTSELATEYEDINRTRFASPNKGHRRFLALCATNGKK